MILPMTDVYGTGPFGPHNAIALIKSALSLGLDASR